MYLLPAFKTVSIFFLFISLIAGIFFTGYAKQIVNTRYTNALAIEAYEEHMILTYYDKNSKRTLHIYYEDIIQARFSNNKYTGFQILFSENDRSFITETNLFSEEIIKPLYNNLFLFSVNPLSYEQFFFLYIAEELFEIKKFNKTKQFYKAYGSKEEYLEMLEGES